MIFKPQATVAPREHVVAGQFEIGFAARAADEDLFRADLRLDDLSVGASEFNLHPGAFNPNPLATFAADEDHS